MLGKLTQPNRLVLVLLLTLGLVPGLSQSNRSAISSIQAQVYSYDFDDGLIQSAISDWERSATWTRS